ncbi:MAG TPA: amidohydrolase family protein [Rhizomicrobium sp.]
MRIDAHHHLWRPARGDYGWLTPDLRPLYRDFDAEDLQPMLQAAKIDATILVQAAPTEAETDYLLAIAQQTPWIAGVVGWTDLAAPDAAAQVVRLAGKPRLVGLRPMLQDMQDPNWILTADVRDGLSAMAKHGLVFDALVREFQLPAIVQLAERFPELSIVLDHAGKPVIDGSPSLAWQGAIGALAEHPNTSVKLSGLLTEVPAGSGPEILRPYIDRLLETFGPDRILWGSDWPVLNLASSYQAWTAMTEALIGGLSTPARQAIRGGTAARIYGIGGRD